MGGQVEDGGWSEEQATARKSNTREAAAEKDAAVPMWKRAYRSVCTRPSSTDRQKGSAEPHSAQNPLTTFFDRRANKKSLADRLQETQGFDSLKNLVDQKLGMPSSQELEDLESIKMALKK